MLSTFLRTVTGRCACRMRIWSASFSIMPTEPITGSKDASRHLADVPGGRTASRGLASVQDYVVSRCRNDTNIPQDNWRLLFCATATWFNLSAGQQKGVATLDNCVRITAWKGTTPRQAWDERGVGVIRLFLAGFGWRRLHKPFETRRCGDGLGLLLLGFLGFTISVLFASGHDFVLRPGTGCRASYHYRARSGATFGISELRWAYLCAPTTRPNQWAEQLIMRRSKAADG